MIASKRLALAVVLGFALGASGGCSRGVPDSAAPSEAKAPPPAINTDASPAQPATPAPSQQPTSPPEGSKPAGTEAQSEQSVADRTVVAVSKAIREHGLTDRKDECLAYGFDDTSEADAYVVEVRENHRRASCGGDPQTSPRLFTVRVAKDTGQMSTDAKSPGEFRPLK